MRVVIVSKKSVAARASVGGAWGMIVSIGREVLMSSFWGKEKLAKFSVSRGPCS